jgi:hypothetical protein
MGVDLASTKVLDGEVDGRKAPEDRDFERSLAEADRKAKELLGQKTTVYRADTTSGKYRGEVFGETDHHLLQKLSPRSVVAHPKQALPSPQRARSTSWLSLQREAAKV